MSHTDFKPYRTSDNPLFVAQPIKPDEELLHSLITKVSNSRQYTNFGSTVNSLADAIGERWGISKVELFCNGTIALLAALLAVERKGEVITTPFTFPATAHAAVLAGHTVRFVDIDPNTYNINPELIESAICDQTVAIVGVHVYGELCDVTAISDLCRRYKLMEIYDAAHCVDVFYGSRSAFSYGDMSIASFHATKLLHTGEGGAVFINNEEYGSKIRDITNFGIRSEEVVSGVGLNGKMSEFAACVGHSVLPLVSNEIEKRESIYRHYMKRLGDLEELQFQQSAQEIRKNYQYFPVLFGTAEVRDRIFTELRANNVYARKYFYPTLVECAPYCHTMSPHDYPVARDVSRRVLCLPIHGGVPEDDVKYICDVVKVNLGH